MGEGKPSVKAEFNLQKCQGLYTFEKKFSLNVYLLYAH